MGPKNKRQKVEAAEVVGVDTLKSFLTKYFDVFDDMSDIDFECDSIVSHEFFLEYITSSKHCGWDFSKYPTHQLFDSGSGDFFAGILNLDSAGGQLDKCPIYIFDLGSIEHPPSFEGNFRSYLTNIFKGYIECEDANQVEEAEKALEELKTFSDEVIMPVTTLSCADFGFEALSMN